MKIRAVYYLNEPEDLECDIFEVRVELVQEDDISKEEEYAFTATTLKFLQKQMSSSKKSYFRGLNSPLIVFSKLDDTTILNAINDFLPEIKNVAKKIY